MTLKNPQRFVEALGNYIKEMGEQYRLIQAYLRAEPITSSRNPKIMALQLMTRAGLQTQRFLDVLENAAAITLPLQTYSSSDVLVGFYSSLREADQLTTPLLRPQGIGGRYSIHDRLKIIQELGLKLREAQLQLQEFDKELSYAG